MNEVAIITPNQQIDAFEAALVETFPIIDCPLRHTRTPGLYTREIFMPAGSWIVSMIHRLEHPYFIMYGRVSVYSEKDGVEILEAPYRGITQPGTRRILYCHTDVIWATCHVCGDEETIDEIGDRILEKHENLLLHPWVKKIISGIHKNNINLQLIDNV